jgi:hypothetical protein
MQKLLLKSIYMLCKWCRSSYKEDNKISFAFLRFFSDFIWIFQGTGSSWNKTKNLLQTWPLERFKSSQICHWGLHKGPCTVLTSHMCPQRRGWAHRRWGGARVGKQARVWLGSPRFDWRRWFDRRGTRRCPAARQRRRLRCGSVSGAMWGPTKPCTRVGARVMPRGEA